MRRLNRFMDRVVRLPSRGLRRAKAETKKTKTESQATYCVDEMQQQQQQQEGPKKDPLLIRQEWSLSSSDKKDYATNFSKAVQLNGEDLVLHFGLKSHLGPKRFSFLPNSQTTQGSPYVPTTAGFNFSPGTGTSSIQNCTVSCELELKEIYSSSKTALILDLTKVFEEADDLPFSDVMLLCGEDSYPCHKFILATRSDVFAAMFSSTMKEANENIVEIKDTEPHVLKKLLQFIYTDSVKDIQIFDDASAVLALADKYNVKKLKKSCEEIICKMLNLSNVVDATILANRHDAPHLLSSALDFAISNLHNLIETQELDKISKMCPNVFVEILKKISKASGPNMFSKAFGSIPKD